jgi:hypothetical protein
VRTLSIARGSARWSLALVATPVALSLLLLIGAAIPGGEFGPHRCA